MEVYLHTERLIAEEACRLGKGLVLTSATLLVFCFTVPLHLPLYRSDLLNFVGVYLLLAVFSNHRALDRRQGLCFRVQAEISGYRRLGYNSAMDRRIGLIILYDCCMHTLEAGMTKKSDFGLFFFRLVVSLLMVRERDDVM